MSTKAISKVNYWLKNIQYALLPGSCIQCNQATDRHYDLCLDCEQRLPRIKDPCLVCGLPLPANNFDGHICGSCILTPPPFKHVLAALDYADPIDKLISRFKYQGRLAFGKVLSHQLLKQVRSFYDKQSLPELLIPMPLHPSRLQQRGFNQSVEISRYLSRELGLEHNYKLCFRERNTSQQEGLNAVARRKNLRRAFALLDNNSVLPKSVAIIDDVVTTTASVRELSLLLLKYGVEDIHVWSLARACKKL